MSASSRRGRRKFTSDVVALVAKGYTNREVVESLYVRPKPVRYHLGNVFAKLGITSRRQLRARATP